MGGKQDDPAVMPAKAGIQLQAQPLSRRMDWIPASAGMTAGVAIDDQASR